MVRQTPGVATTPDSGQSGGSVPASPAGSGGTDMDSQDEQEGTDMGEPAETPTEALPEEDPEPALDTPPPEADVPPEHEDSPEVEDPPDIEDQPEEYDMRAVSLLPVIGITALCLFIGGSLLFVAFQATYTPRV